MFVIYTLLPKWQHIPVQRSERKKKLTLDVCSGIGKYFKYSRVLL